MIQGFRRQKGISHNFSEIPRANMPRSNFSRNRSLKTAFDASYLIPIYLDEVLPGDTFNVNLTAVARLSTPIVPFMDNLYLDFFFFFVPMRLIWNNAHKFFGAQDDPGDSIDYTIPQIVSHASNGWTVSSLGDYFGIPPAITSLSTNALPFRCYNLIWNEWFRSQDLQNSVVVDKDDGPDTESDYVLLKRGKRHDYFTSALPYPQKDDVQITLPIGDEAPIKTDETSVSDMSILNGNDALMKLSANTTYLQLTATAGTYDMYADLSAATASDINEIREAFQLQKMIERDARGGTRYAEIIQSHFNVISPDARLQRPEYLGGGTSIIAITPVAQTSESSTTKQGTLAAVGYGSKSGVGFTKSFVEHGFIIGLTCCNQHHNLYQQGLPRLWSRSTREDFYWPSLAHLGEDAILSKEIWCDGGAGDDNVFGYQERWSNYRYAKSQVTGILRSDAASNVDEWHLGIDFATRPSLNAAFIVDATPVSRVVATPSEPEIILDAYFQETTTRCLPANSIPGLIDHF